MTAVLIYVELALTTTAYAIVLQIYGEAWRSGVLFQVIIGFLICLGASALIARQGPDITWREHEVLVVKCFIVGGFPISCWQIGLMVRQYLRRVKALRSGALD